MYLIDGVQVEKENFILPVENIGVWRGDGIFEAIRIHKGYPFGIDLHIERFKNSASKVFFNDINFEKIKKDILFVAENFQNGYVRTLILRNEKDTFKTAFEIDQRWIVELGADRTPHISQAQSVNIFVPADIHKKELHDIHFQAWKKGLKSLYYCRSKSIQRAENVNNGSSTDVTKNVYSGKQESNNESNNYEECLSCQ